ncbi:U-box domain-containing protein 33-like [Carex rostrata]
MSERDDATKLSEVTQKQLMSERDDAEKLSEATKEYTNQLMSERDDAEKLSEAAQKQLMSERDDARKLSEATKKLTEQLMSERDDAKRLSEATQKQLMSERDDARKLSEMTQKQLMSERDDAKKNSEAAQKFIEQLTSERDYAIKQVEELQWLTEQQAPGRKCVGCFIGYSNSELQHATNNFHKSFKIGEGGFGKVYKGILHNTTIAIKILNEGSSQGEKEFHQEVEVLSKLQHPNLVKLIGACPEIHAIIYEYLPNGSLEDRLPCKNNTSPLSWQARVRIAFEICEALSFLHSSNGDLKPGNVLFDLNDVSKLSDFGLCRQLNLTTNASRPIHYTKYPKGTIGYIDPEYSATGTVTHQNDVYSFGIMLLQLVTCKEPQGIRQLVEKEHGKGTLKSLIDASAGPWPFKEAEKMTSLGLRCSNIMRINRPDLSTAVLKEMKSMADVACASQWSWAASLFR